jgi:hypothetical protein
MAFFFFSCSKRGRGFPRGALVLEPVSEPLAALIRRRLLSNLHCLRLPRGGASGAHSG